MFSCFDSLRQFTFTSVCFRFALALFMAGVLGIERQRKWQSAGFRTYMLVCLGATLAMMFGIYEWEVYHGVWENLAKEYKLTADVCRLSAQVISGIGFLGAGTIMVTKRQVNGLTTAAGLWAVACMGIAVGAGFFEAAILAFFLILLCYNVLKPFEESFLQHAPNMNIFVEMDSLDVVGAVLGEIRMLSAKVYEVSLNRKPGDGKPPTAIFELRLPPHTTHAQMLAKFAAVPGVASVDEL